MADAPNKLVRLLVPLVLFLLAVVLAVAVVRQKPTPASSATPSSPPAAQAIPPQTPTAQPEAQTQAQPVPVAASADNQPAPGQTVSAPAPHAPTPSAPTPSAPGPTNPPTATPALLQGLRARPVVTAQPFSMLGGLEPARGERLQLRFSPFGAGLESITLADHFDTVKRETPSVIQQQHVFPATEPKEVATPFALRDLEINGQLVSVSGITYIDQQPYRAAPCWHELAPGKFQAIIINAEDQEIVRVTRTYTLQPDSHALDFALELENLTAQPLTLRWRQFGPVDLPQDSKSYGGDKRRIRYGYLLNPAMQGGDPTVLSNDFFWWRSEILGSTDATGFAPRALPATPAADGVTNLYAGGWPNSRSFEKGYRLAWVANTNRYFGVGVHPLADPTSGPNQKLLPIDAIDRFWIPSGDPVDPMVVVLRLISPAVTIQPQQRHSTALGIYAGPLSRPEILSDPQAASMGLDGLVRYNFGGPCGFCTFPWLTGLLLVLLRVLHDYVLFDWALAIMVLVLIVRTLLHPISKWSQIRMQRFGKQMQGMAPKMKIIQEKYKGDPLKLREESAKLWREEGVNPAGMLGCIPMFLQTPIWIALYAMLYFAVELRHQPGFFGVFQALAPGYPSFLGWFLGDLAEPDRLVHFGRTLVNLPLLGPIESLNILPLLLGIVFFIQQKYLTPPTAPGTLSPEQEQTQFMMKIMMVVMFPLFMYNAPSGLAIYFLTNSTLSILESRYIRHLVEKHDLANPKKSASGGPKGEGFFARIMAKAEERKKQYEEMQKRMQKQANRKR
jgi:YidC/Oxa1 family membrane protein insertase